MATKLEKDISRESSAKADNREIIITITASQKVSLKLKGKRIGEVSIDIDKLYGQLTGAPIAQDTLTEKKEVSIVHSDTKPSKKNPMILLSDLRSQNAISGLDIPTLVKFEGIIKSLLDAMK